MDCHQVNKVIWTLWSNDCEDDLFICLRLINLVLILFDINNKEKYKITISHQITSYHIYHL